MVGEAGLEPARPQWTLEPESSESTNSTTRPYQLFHWGKKLVGEAGLEPARPQWTLEPESSESTNSTTRPFLHSSIELTLKARLYYHSRRNLSTPFFFLAKFGEKTPFSRKMSGQAVCFCQKMSRNQLLESRGHTAEITAPFFSPPADGWPPQWS